jgi:hypothetical protein
MTNEANVRLKYFAITANIPCADHPSAAILEIPGDRPGSNHAYPDNMNRQGSNALAVTKKWRNGWP